MRKWINKVVCQSEGKTHYLSIFLNEKQIKADLSGLPKVSGQAEERVLVPERLDDISVILLSWIMYRL